MSPPPELLAPTGLSARALDRHAYAHDASHYLLTPTAVARPDSVDAVVDLLRFATGTGQSVTFRSGGTSLSGQGVTGAILADVRRGFRGWEVRDGGRRITCRPGTTVRQANTALARHGYRLGPDPASEVACTLGGVVANNSSGMACGTTQNVYRTLESLVVVLADGTLVDTSRADADRRLRETRPDLHEGLRRLRRRVLGDPESRAIIAHQFSMKNTMGYGLNALTDFEAPADMLAHLMVGSEGTLGFVAEATFATVPVLPHSATGLLIFPTLAEATAALPALVDTGLATVELMDATSLRVAQTLAAVPPEIADLAVQGHCGLLVEARSLEPDDLRAQQQRLQELTDDLELAAPAALTRDAAAQQVLWHTRRGLYTTVAEARPTGTSALLEDIAVPVADLYATCRDLTDLLDAHRYDNAVIFGHAKDGNLHFMITERFGEADAVRRYEEFTEDLVELVLGHRGTLKAEHGTGRIMAPFVRRQFGAELHEVMREVKRLFDPAGVLNPGVVLTDDPTAYLRDLKTAPTVEEEVDRCVECGYCEPVCPSKDLTLTPRQRIALRREIVAARERGDVALAETLTEDYSYDGVETCAVDGMCATTCPVTINTGDLVRRLRAETQPPTAQRIGTLAARHWQGLTTGAGLALTVADALPAPVVSAATEVGRRLLGTDVVPRYDASLPRGGERRRRTDQPGSAPAAVYVPACLGRLFGPGDPPASPVRDSVLALAERAGVGMLVPDAVDRWCCGTPWKSKGLTQGYAAISRRVRPGILEATQGGTLPVVVDSSSCAHGFADLLAGAATVRDVTDWVAEHLLDRLTVTRRLPSLALHPTCSGVQTGSPALRQIAAVIAESVVVPDRWGCCAFAGDRGMLHPELTASATAAEASEIRRTDYAAYASDNRTCELGMTRATGRPYRHVLDLLEECTRPG